MQVSCNDWHIESEMSSAYLLEKLLASCRHAGVEASLGPDDAEGDDPDGWVESTYAMLQPFHIPHNANRREHPRLNGFWQRPWADEMKVNPTSSCLSLYIYRLCMEIVNCVVCWKNTTLARGFCKTAARDLVADLLMCVLQ